MKDFSIINREAILLMIEHAADEAAVKAVKLYAANNPPPQDETRLLTKKEAAAFLRVTVPTIDRWRNDHPLHPTLKTTMVGGIKPRFKMSDLMSTLEGGNVTK
jgi:hypothetical protein